MISKKEQLRKEIAHVRDQLPIEYRTAASKIICDLLIGFPEFQRATTISFYKAMHSEVDLDIAMEKAWSEGIFVALPRVIAESGLMDFYRVDQETELIKGSCGSFEPPLIASKEVGIEQLQMILVPGVAFDTQGYRLGYGGGYYDRLFEKCPKDVLRVGIGFDEQVVPTVYPESHDQRIDVMITSTGVIRYE